MNGGLSVLRARYPQPSEVRGAVDQKGRDMTPMVKVELKVDLAEILKWIAVLIWLFQ